MATLQPSTFTIIGKPIPRVEGVDKVTGAAAYTADVLPEGVVWARNVRSSFPHARILSIDTSKARATPGADIPAKKVSTSSSARISCLALPSDSDCFPATAADNRSSIICRSDSGFPRCESTGCS